MTRSPSKTRRPAGRGGFTFVELMISIALVIVLMLGVNQIFSFTSRAVGAGEAVNTAIRDSRAMGESFAADFAAMVPNGNGPTDAAFMVIRSGNAYAWRDAADQAGSQTGDVTKIDLNGNNVEGESNVAGEVVSPITTNYRSHREDVFSFFARGQFQRQTGNANTFVAPMSSAEAYVWYGHLALPDNSYDTTRITANQYPGINAAGASTATNPNNFYASQFVLGRQAILLREKDANGQIFDDEGNPQMFVDGGTFGSVARGASINATNVPSEDGLGTDTLTDSRVDLAATSIAGVRSGFTSFVAPFVRPAFGWNPGNLTQQQKFNNDPKATYWWDYLPDGNVAPAAGGGSMSRFKCNPFVTKPMTAKDMAQSSPYMLRGVSQFVVEFAGDYLQQENNPNSSKYGQVLANYINPLLNPSVAGIAPPFVGTGTDGQVDYVLIPPVNNAVNIPRGQWRKQIRWYGFPRNTGGNAVMDPLKYGDVVPLAWHLKHAMANGNLVVDPYSSSGIPGTGPGCGEMSFEKSLPPDVPSGNYATGLTAGTNYQYIAAFGPNDPKPKLIRITVTLDDPTGRLPDGQTFQYVYPVP